QALSVRAEVERGNDPIVALQRQPQVARRRYVPEAHRAVAGRDHALPIGTEGGVVYCCSVPFEHCSLLAAGRVPDARRGIRRAAEQVFAVSAELHGADARLMATEAEQFLAGGDFP